VVDSLANGHVDAFCVGAPWNSVAVDLGVGHILHFVSDILLRAAEKVLAVRQNWADKNPDILKALVARISAPPNSSSSPKIEAEAAACLRNRNGSGSMPASFSAHSMAALKISPMAPCARAAAICWSGREDAGRPDPVQAAWLYAQMCVGQTAISPDALKTAMGVSAGLYDDSRWPNSQTDGASGRIGALPARPSIRRHRRPSGGLQNRALEAEG